MPGVNPGPCRALACRYERALVDAELHSLGDQLLKKFDETERALLTVSAVQAGYAPPPPHTPPSPPTHIHNKGCLARPICTA